MLSFIYFCTHIIFSTYNLFSFVMPHLLWLHSKVNFSGKPSLVALGRVKCSCSVFFLFVLLVFCNSFAWDFYLNFKIWGQGHCHFASTEFNKEAATLWSLKFIKKKKSLLVRSKGNSMWVIVFSFCSCVAVVTLKK